MNRFSKDSFNKYSSNIEAIEELLLQIDADPKDKKLIDQINKFFNVEMFKFLGEGSFARAYQINNKEILRISQSIPKPLPNDPHVNQRSGFLKINEWYLEKFPLLEANVHPGKVKELLEEKYPEAWDLEPRNFGKDPETGVIKTLDPGVFVPLDEEKELQDENKFMELQHKYKNLLDAVKDNPFNIRFIPAEYQTEEMGLIAVRHEPGLVRNIENQTEQICLEAVSQNGWHLEGIKKQTPRICLEAVKEEPWVLGDCHFQTPEICMAAVIQEGDTLKYVKDQTPEICMAAVKQKGEALQFVKDQTYEICREAVKQDEGAYKYIRDPQIKEKLIKELEGNPAMASNRFNKNNFKFIYSSEDEDLRKELKDYIDGDRVHGKLLLNLLNDHGCTLSEFKEEGGKVHEDGSVNIDELFDWLGY